MHKALLQSARAAADLLIMHQMILMPNFQVQDDASVFLPFPYLLLNRKSGLFLYLDSLIKSPPRQLPGNLFVSLSAAADIQLHGLKFPFHNLPDRFLPESDLVNLLSMWIFQSHFLLPHKHTHLPEPEMTDL